MVHVKLPSVCSIEIHSCCLPRLHHDGVPPPECYKFHSHECLEYRIHTYDNNFDYCIFALCVLFLLYMILVLRHVLFLLLLLLLLLPNGLLHGLFPDLILQTGILYHLLEVLQSWPELPLISDLLQSGSV